jgi:hypothetical protein
MTAGRKTAKPAPAGRRFAAELHGTLAPASETGPHLGKNFCFYPFNKASGISFAFPLATDRVAPAGEIALPDPKRRIP